MPLARRPSVYCDLCANVSKLFCILRSNAVQNILLMHWLCNTSVSVHACVYTVIRLCVYVCLIKCICKRVCTPTCIYQAIHQPLNQSLNHSTNQSITQSIVQSIHQSRNALVLVANIETTTNSEIISVLGFITNSHLISKQLRI